MTAGSRRDEEHKPEDALDRVIDETLGAAMRAHPVDLRERVLARLDETADAPPAWWRFVLRPALLPAAGAALVVVGVALTWQHVDHTLARIGTPRTATRVAATRTHAAPAPKTMTEGARAASPAVAMVAARPSSGPAVRAVGQRIVAASLLDTDAMSKPAAVAADVVLLGDDAAAAPVLPGAMGGDLGDPIKPMPPLRPLVIQPIVTAPIIEAPPVSTLAPPVGVLPTVGEISRDPSDPGKPGGVRQ